MALLGAQLVITLIMVSVIQKLGIYSFARWLLCSNGLYRYLYPTNSELKSLTNFPKDKSKSKKGGKSDTNGKPETFHVPRSLDLSLEKSPVTILDVVHLRFYSEYQWIVDFSVYSLIVYIMSELFNTLSHASNKEQYIQPPMCGLASLVQELDYIKKKVYNMLFPFKDEFNLSMLWCLLVVLFALKALLQLTKQYFTSEESIGERSTCIVSFCVFLLIAMMVLIVDERNLEVGVDPAYDSFHENASKFLAEQGLDNVGPASKLIVKLCLAVMAAVIGMLFTFPGMRVARMHWDLIRQPDCSKLKLLLLNINFAMPFLLTLLWIRPITRDYLTERVFSGMENPLLTTSQFDGGRLIIICLSLLLRLVLMPTHLQAYLDLAQTRLEVQKKEAGNITNIELQKKIASVFYYLCVVALQYITPVVLLLNLTLMYKTLGGYSWNVWSEHNGVCNAQVTSPANFTEEAGIKESVQQFQLALDNLKMVFTEEVYRGVFGFLSWWSCFSYFLTTALGAGYQTYFRTS